MWGGVQSLAPQEYLTSFQNLLSCSLGREHSKLRGAKRTPQEFKTGWRQNQISNCLWFYSKLSSCSRKLRCHNMLTLGISVGKSILIENWDSPSMLPGWAGLHLIKRPLSPHLLSHSQAPKSLQFHVLGRGTAVIGGP